MKSGNPLVRHQLLQGDVPPSRGQLRQPPADGVAEAQHALVDQYERGGAGERLRHARDPHVIADRGRRGPADLGDAAGEELAITLALHDDRDSGRPTGHGDQFADRSTQRGVVGSGAAARRLTRLTTDAGASGCEH
jgi:hypothetical protein